MGISFIALLAIFGILILGGDALRCKCTQSSNKAPCHDGVCDVNEGACLMLEHPTSGQLYACSSSSLPDGTCAEKTTKSGVNVKYCSCTGKDFCNYEKWPDHHDDSYDSDEDRPRELTSFSVNKINTNLPFLIASFIIFLSL